MGTLGRAHGFLNGLLQRPISRVLAPGLGFAAIATPFVEGSGPEPWQQSPMAIASYFLGPGAFKNHDGTTNYGASLSNVVSYGVPAFIDSMVANWPTMLGFGVGAAVARWGGRKLRI